MKKTLAIITLSMSLMLVFSGCKDRSTDSFWVINQYLAALEQGNLEKAYRFVSERPILVVTSTGEEVLFRARPDMNIFKSRFEGLSGMKVLEIERMNKLSIAEQLDVYHVVVKGIEHTEEQVAEDIKILIEMYLAPDSTGSWKVLLPSSSSPTEQVETENLEIT